MIMKIDQCVQISLLQLIEFLSRQLINGKDIVKETKEARSVLGYCPQHNLLFDDMTVYEHLKFFSQLKQNYNENEINRMLDLINLTDKRNSLARTLSGGMKRKLSVAIAFIGGSKTVILDEPSNINIISFNFFYFDKNIYKYIYRFWYGSTSKTFNMDFIKKI